MFLKYTLATAAIIFSSSFAKAGVPFQCTLNVENGSQKVIFLSTPMLGHGMDNWASQSFTYADRDYLFEAESNIFNDSLTLTVHTEGFFALAKNELFVSAGGIGIQFKCTRL